MVTRVENTLSDSLKRRLELLSTQLQQLNAQATTEQLVQHSQGLRQMLEQHEVFMDGFLRGEVSRGVRMGLSL